MRKNANFVYNDFIFQIRTHELPLLMFFWSQEFEKLSQILYARFWIKKKYNNFDMG